MSNRAVLFDRRTQPSGFKNGAIQTPPPKDGGGQGVGQGQGGGRGQGAQQGKGVGKGQGLGQGQGGGSLAALESIAAFFAIGSSSVSTGRVDAPTTSGPILLKTVAGDGTSANLDFTSIQAGYNSLTLFAVGRSSAAAATDAVTLRVNNDSGTSYDWVNVRGVNSATSSGNSGAGASSIDCVAATGDTAPGNYASLFIVDVPFYTATTFNKVLRISNHELGAQSAAGVSVAEISGFWRSTAAVTRLTLILATGNWKTGSTGLLYGYP